MPRPLFVLCKVPVPPYRSFPENAFFENFRAIFLSLHLAASDAISYLCASCGQEVYGSRRDPDFGLCPQCTVRISRLSPLWTTDTTHQLWPAPISSSRDSERYHFEGARPRIQGNFDTKTGEEHHGFYL